MTTALSSIRIDKPAASQEYRSASYSDMLRSSRLRQGVGLAAQHQMIHASVKRRRLVLCCWSFVFHHVHLSVCPRSGEMVHFFRKQRAKMLSGVVQAGLHRAAADLQFSGDVVDRHVLAVVEHDDLPVFDGKLLQRFRHEYGGGGRIRRRVLRDDLFFW